MVWFNSLTEEKIDSRELYNSLARFKLNVVDIGNLIYVHGDIELRDIPMVISICIKYGLEKFEIQSR